jgi:hypothetical protein
MPLAEAAACLYLDKTTLSKGLCGTDGLQKIYQGRRVYFIRSQVEAHKRNLIQAALSRQERLYDLATKTRPNKSRGR